MKAAGVPYLITPKAAILFSAAILFLTGIATKQMQFSCRGRLQHAMVLKDEIASSIVQVPNRKCHKIPRTWKIRSPSRIRSLNLSRN